MIEKKVKIGVVFTPINHINIDLPLLPKKLKNEKKWTQWISSNQRKLILRFYNIGTELEILQNGTLFYYELIGGKHITGEKLCAIFNIGLEYVEKLQNLFQELMYENDIAFIFEGQKAFSISKEKIDKILGDILVKNIGKYTIREYMAGESYSSVTFNPIISCPKRLNALKHR